MPKPSKPADLRITRKRRAKPGPKPKVKPKAKTSSRPGTPTKFRDEFIPLARSMCEVGASLADLAQVFEVSEATIYRWRAENPEFHAAIQVGEYCAEAAIKGALFQRAKGYTFETYETKVVGEEEIQVRKVQHIPPDTKAGIFLLTQIKKREDSSGVGSFLKTINCRPIRPREVDSV